MPLPPIQPACNPSSQALPAFPEQSPCAAEVLPLDATALTPPAPLPLSPLLPLLPPAAHLLHDLEGHLLCGAVLQLVGGPVAAMAMLPALMVLVVVRGSMAAVAVAVTVATPLMVVPG